MRGLTLPPSLGEVAAMGVGVGVGTPCDDAVPVLVDVEGHAELPGVEDVPVFESVEHLAFFLTRALLEIYEPEAVTPGWLSATEGALK